MSTTTWFWIFSAVYAVGGLFSFFVFLPMSVDLLSKNEMDMGNSTLAFWGVVNWLLSFSLFLLAYKKLGENEWLAFLAMATGLASAIVITLAVKTLLSWVDSIRSRRQQKQYHGARTTTR